MKKIVENYNVSNYEVLTDIGYVDIQQVMKTVPYQVYELTFDDGTVLRCADNHILIDVDDNEIFAKDSINIQIKTNNATSKVLSIDLIDDVVDMYDLRLSHHHKYYTNDVLSHNTTVVGGYLLHLAIFNKDYNIACLANKRDQARETLARIQLMYEDLPWWLQVGVKGWNKGDIWLGNGKNGTKVFSAATSGSSVRGKSLNCIGGSQTVKIQDKNTFKTEVITLTNLEKRFEDIHVED